MSRGETLLLPRRRMLIGISAAAAAIVTTRGLLHAQVISQPTPRQTEGPFYPVDWGGDADNDLVRVKGEAAQAIGQVLHIQGHVFDLRGQPVQGALVEIWQCDGKGIYHHPRNIGGGRQPDSGFQGRGRSEADAQGRYSFRTIRPVAYPGRTPHIHFNIAHPDGQNLVTQMYIHGEPQNERDGVLNRIRDPRQRDSVIVKLEPADAIEPGALLGNFDIWFA